MRCAIIVGPTLIKAQEQLKEAIALADLAELRLDLMKEISFEEIAKLEFPKKLIFTSRSKELHTLLELAKLQPDYMDLEHDTPSFFEKIRQQYPKIKLIASIHDFTREPLEALKQIEDLPADMYKIVVKSRTTIEALQLLTLFHSKPLIVSGVYESGFLTRLLGPIYNSAWSYAPLDLSQATAPGQIPIRELYPVSHSTKVYGLIGDPVDKSFGHILHNGAMKAFGANSVYVKMRVTPEELAAFIPYIKSLNFRGLSVTMPLKEAILPYLDAAHESVQNIGACNTLLWDGKKLQGYNTDGIGALNALEEVMEPSGKKLTLIGAGGAARAIAWEALKRGMQVKIVNRDAERAKALGKDFNCLGAGLDQLNHEYDVLINSTPIDMPSDCLKPGAVVMDIRNRKEPTPFLLAASQQGCIPISGLRMYLHQAVEQIKIWNYAGRPLPSDEIWDGFASIDQSFARSQPISKG